MTGRMKVALAAAALLVLPALFAPPAPFARSALGQDEKPAPKLSATGVVNLPATKRPLDLLGGRLVLLQFFAPWSERCVDAIPHLTKLENRFGGRGLSVLAIAEGDVDALKTWVDEHQVEFGVAALDTLTFERVKNHVSMPGMPHAALISPDGKIVMSGHPQSMKERHIKPHLKGIRTPPPRLPVALSAQQAQLEAGEWGAVRASCESGMESLDKISKQWARGLVEWIDERRGSWLTDAAAHREAGRYWDAWDMFADFPRRFDGLEGAPEATAAAEAIRADKAATRELEAGDTLQKGRDKLAAGESKKAKLIFQRVIRAYKKTIHAERAKALLKTIK